MANFFNLFQSSTSANPGFVLGEGGFIDHFNAFDDSRWIIDDGYGNGGIFLNEWAETQVSFASGGMTITLDDHDSNPSTPLVSGSLRSQQTFRYGYYEARFKTSNVPGTITGFFLYTGPSAGTPHDEIDIEIKGDNPTKIQVNYWTDGVEHPTVLDLGFDASAEFHTYGFRWLPNAIEWYVDGELLHSENGMSGTLPITPGQIFFNFWATTGAMPWSSDFDETNAPASVNVKYIAYNPTAEVLPRPIAPLISHEIKGIAYYRGKNDIMTGMYSIGANFVGTIKIQATLLDNPTETDWFDVTESIYTANYTDLPTLPTTFTFNAKGNFVKLRGVIENYIRGSIMFVKVGY